MAPAKQFFCAISPTGGSKPPVRAFGCEFREDGAQLFCERVIVTTPLPEGPTTAHLYESPDAEPLVLTLAWFGLPRDALTNSSAQYKSVPFDVLEAESAHRTP